MYYIGQNKLVTCIPNFADLYKTCCGRKKLCWKNNETIKKKLIKYILSIFFYEKRYYKKNPPAWDQCDPEDCSGLLYICRVFF